MDVTFWGVALLSAFLVGAGKGGLPMVALLSVPTLSLVMPPMLGAALLLPVYLISDAYGIYIYRRAFSRRNLLILTPAAALGIAVGFLMADTISDDAVRVVIGCVGLMFLAMRLASRLRGAEEARPADVPRGILWGSVSGFTSFVSHAGAPAFQLYALPQKMPKLTFAGTSTILFALVNWMKVPPYMTLGLLQWADLRIVAVLAPAAMIGAWLGYRLIVLVPERVFFIVIEIALLVISLNLIRIGLPALLA